MALSGASAGNMGRSRTARKVERIERLSFFDAIPPQSLEGEQSVLGAMLIERAAAERAAERIHADDFYRDAHRVIFEALTALLERDAPIDLLTSRDELERMEVLENVGGGTYLIQLTNSVPSAANVDYYIKIVQDRARRRRLIDAAAQIHALARTSEEDIDSVEDRADLALQTALDHGAESSRLLGGVVSASAIPARRNRENLWFGLYPASAHLFVGESGSGKSSGLYNVAIHAARNDRLWGEMFGLSRPARVLYIDPENAGLWRDDDPEQRDGGNCAAKLARILGGEVAPPTLKFADGEGMNLSLSPQRRDLVRYIAAGLDGSGAQPFDLVILDPILALFAVEDENSNAEMDRVGQGVKELARKSGAAIVAVHHTGKAGLTASGVLSGRGASALSGPMDVISTWRLQRPSDDERDDTWSGESQTRQGICRWCIEKDRFGVYSDVSLYLRMGSPRQDCFEAVKKADWDALVKGADQKPGRPHQLEHGILDFVTNNPGAGFEQIHTETAASRFGKNFVRKTLAAMVDAGALTAERRGRGGELVYSRSAGEPPSNGNGAAAPAATAESLPHLDDFMAGLSGKPEKPDTESGEL